MTLVSVLTPSFQQGRFIGDCLQSVAAQTHRPLEHIVYDGGSTDETLATLQRAGDHVTWRSEPDRGQANALNKAFALSQGEIIGWLNSDDAYADRRSVERAVRIFEQEPPVDVVYGHALLINEQNEVLQVLPALPFSRYAYTAVHYVIQPTVFVRRSALIREPFFVREDLDYVIDRDLFVRLSAHARFRRAPGATAVDRHQRARKVLAEGFEAEAKSFDRELGASGRRAAAIRSLVLLTGRIAGAFTMVRLARTLEPALRLEFPAAAQGLRLQLLTRRQQMRF